MTCMPYVDSSTFFSRNVLEEAILGFGSLWPWKQLSHSHTLFQGNEAGRLHTHTEAGLKTATQSVWGILTIGPCQLPGISSILHREKYAVVEEAEEKMDEGAVHWFQIAKVAILKKNQRNKCTILLSSVFWWIFWSFTAKCLTLWISAQMIRKSMRKKEAKSNSPN